ncbi:hypothetical protein [Methanoregula sp. PtaB.Bin085]|uniref:hypothetical protein n=1 Tax=Methanoregula sp. PtaB.Bin085 TaxID=1811680 RepID=UPI0025DD4B7B|nr:hypothetical protein [Methanoregula sp. PtaB.Bin085]
MKIPTTARALLLLLAGIVLLCISPVSATSQIVIDPVPGNLMTGSIIELSGSTTLPVGTNLQYEFSREAADTGKVKYGEYSGAGGIIPVEKGAAGQIWKVPIITEGYAPAEYTFRIGKEGSDDRVSVQVRLIPGNGTPVPTPKATQGTRCAEFKSPVYISPGGTLAVRTLPDLNTRCNILAKGAPLRITVATSPGNRVGIWITNGFPVNRFTRYQMISADGVGKAEFDLPNTTEWRSGQYFIYVVDGGKTLEVLPDEKEPSAYIPADELETKLKVYEKQNPYQKFMILLEEPVIQMNEIPDAVSGTPVEISGTTNLNAGTLIDTGIYPPDIDRMNQPASTVPAIPVADGTTGYGSWHAVINTSDLPPGEYIVKVRTGSTEAVRIMVLYDRLYDPGISPSGTLIAKTYSVDPETKTVITGTPAREAGFPANPGILVVAYSAGIIVLGVIINNLRKK